MERNSSQKNKIHIQGASILCMYVLGVGQKSGPCTATFNDLLCLASTLTFHLNIPFFPSSLLPFGSLLPLLEHRADFSIS
jgi:hypothetical protein